MVEISETELRIAVALVGALIGTIVLLLMRQNSPESEAKKTSEDSSSDLSKSLRREQLVSSSSHADLRQQSDDKVLSASVFRPFTVLKTTRVSPNVKLIRFELPAGRTLGLSMGRHVTLRATIDGQPVMRAYTPTTRLDQKGYFELLVKAYEFGKMSSHLCGLKTGQQVEVRGPVGRFKYTPNEHKRIGLIAGGTGLTPCLQLVRNVLEGPEFKEDATCFTLFFQNRAEDDILLMDELQALAKRFPQRFDIVFFLSNAEEESTTYGLVANEKRGYITRELLSEKMNPEICSLVCLCGPSGFNDCVKKHLLSVGHSEEAIFVW